MNIFTAENEHLSLKVKEMGAELSSLALKKNGREYIWGGNPDIWYGQSPILFPFIGRLLDDKYLVNGKEYTCPKHGIVRKKPFSLVSKTSSSLTFLQTEDDSSLLQYPYKFKLYITYTLNGRSLMVNHKVVNTNDCKMYFSIGAHPGFNCEIGDIISFSTPQVVKTERIDDESILISEKFPLLNNEKNIIITDDLFVNDALIISGLTEESLTLKGKDYSLKFSFFNAPVLGIWAKPSAPYVCLEPWFGINDDYNKKSDISQKRGIIELNAGETFSFNWNVEIEN